MRNIKASILELCLDVDSLSEVGRRLHEGVEKPQTGDLKGSAAVTVEHSCHIMYGLN